MDHNLERCESCEHEDGGGIEQGIKAVDHNLEDY